MLRASVKINHEAIKRVKKHIEEQAERAKAHRLTIGIHEDEGEKHKLDYNGNETATPLVVVAAAHELGAGVKERSWLRTWFDQNRNRLVHEMNDVMRAEYKGDHEAVARAGERWANELREWIEMEDGGLAALSPSTVARKQAAGLDRPDTPLFATGELVAAIRSYLDGEKK